MTRALADPAVPVRRSWIDLLFAANPGLWMAAFTPVQNRLPVVQRGYVSGWAGVP